MLLIKNCYLQLTLMIPTPYNPGLCLEPYALIMDKPIILELKDFIQLFF